MGIPLVPLNGAHNIQLYAAAGAKEMYSGFYDPAWKEAFEPGIDLNRMSGFGRSANALSFQELLAAVQETKALGCSFYVTFNAANYSAQARPWLQSYFMQLAWAGADGVILSGPEFIELAHMCGLKAVASTMCGIYNSRIAGLYAQWGMDRLILPRDLSLEELRQIMSDHPQLEYEVFLMRNGCVFSDSHCLGVHGMDCGALCGELREANRKLGERDALDPQKALVASDLHCNAFHKYACGQCALWDLEQMGECAYKIVGRSDDPQALAEDVSLTAANIAIAHECASRQEYLEHMIRNPYEDIVCDRGLNCYYPELFDQRP